MGASCVNTKPKRTFTFKSVEVYVTPSNQVIVEWRMDRCFPLVDSAPVFYVEVARAGGEWTRLNPTEPVDNCWYVDETKYRCSKDSDIFYRVVASDGAQEYTSHPESVLGVWNRHDMLIARDVVRKEYLLLQRYSGTRGLLLKRRNHGVPCSNPSCLDLDLEIPTSTSCPECFGTGFKNGYYNALVYYIDIGAFVRGKDVQLPVGTVDPRQQLGRAVAYPRVDEYDIWVDADKNKRYVIREIEVLVALKNKPLVYKLKLHELPATSVEFEVPLEQAVPVDDPPVEPPPTQGGWRQGISYTEW